LSWIDVGNGLESVLPFHNVKLGWTRIVLVSGLQHQVPFVSGVVLQLVAVEMSGESKKETRVVVVVGLVIF